LLELQNIVVKYGEVIALKSVSLRVGRGQFVSLIGSNGAGKSTTLRSISGVKRVSEGRITFEGTDISSSSPAKILSLGIAHCPEGRRVFPQMTVLENLRMGCYLRSDSAEIKQDIEKQFSQFSRLADRRNQVAGTLSGGEQQMLAIARALMSRPKLIMFDEPSLGLAPNIVQQMFALIVELNKSGTTVLMVEQNANAALSMCDHAYLLEAGRTTLEGTGPSLLADPEVRRAYLGH
jgi:branched-chain amino acid transport system ATP-binding protein